MKSRRSWFTRLRHRWQDRKRPKLETRLGMKVLAVQMAATQRNDRRQNGWVE